MQSSKKLPKGQLNYPISTSEITDFSDTSYSTPIDTDSLLIKDNANSLWKRLTWANLKTYFDTLYAPKSTTAKIIINDTTDSSNVTGVITEVIAKNYEIPANTYSSTDFFKIYTSFVKDAVNGASSVRIKASNTNNFATSTVIAFLSNSTFIASTRRIGLRRQYHKFQSGNLVGFPFATTAVNDEASTTASASTSMVLDPTQTIYVWITIQNASASDGTICNAVQITN